MAECGVPGISALPPSLVGRHLSAELFIQLLLPSVGGSKRLWFMPPTCFFSTLGPEICLASGHFDNAAINAAMNNCRPFPEPRTSSSRCHQVVQVSFASSHDFITSDRKIALSENNPKANLNRDLRASDGLLHRFEAFLRISHLRMIPR
jgi:hypothetical protein